MFIASPLPNQQSEVRPAIERQFREVERELQWLTEVADAFSLTGTFTEQRTIDAGTATATDLRNVLCTFLSDLKKRGVNRVD